LSEPVFENAEGVHARAVPLEKETMMPLRVELKPFERIVIGETVLINSGTRSSFLIDGEAPILREKDTVTAETANTPVKRLYFCIQTMYLKNDIPRYRSAYLGLIKDLRETRPGSRDVIEAVNSHISGGALYKALKEIRKLMKIEDEQPAVNA
jgi:flagellar biosynthesis repressor protein FlbT